MSSTWEQMKEAIRLFETEYGGNKKDLELRRHANQVRVESMLRGGVKPPQLNLSQLDDDASHTVAGISPASITPSSVGDGEKMSPTSKAFKAYLFDETSSEESSDEHDLDSLPSGDLADDDGGGGGGAGKPSPSAFVSSSFLMDNFDGTIADAEKILINHFRKVRPTINIDPENPNRLEEFKVWWSKNIEVHIEAFEDYFKQTRNEYFLPPRLLEEFHANMLDQLSRREGFDPVRWAPTRPPKRSPQEAQTVANEELGAEYKRGALDISSDSMESDEEIEAETIFDIESQRMIPKSRAYKIISFDNAHFMHRTRKCTSVNISEPLFKYFDKHQKYLGKCTFINGALIPALDNPELLDVTPLIRGLKLQHSATGGFIERAVGPANMMFAWDLFDIRKTASFTFKRKQAHCAPFDKLSQLSEMPITFDTVNDTLSFALESVYSTPVMAALIAYSRNWDELMNSSLLQNREEEAAAIHKISRKYGLSQAEILAKNTKLINTLEIGFQREASRINAPTVVFRGSSSSPKFETDENGDMVLEVKRFMSTSVDITVAEDFAADAGSILEIHLPLGLPYYNMFVYSYYRNEYEFLLPPGLTLKMQNRPEKNGNRTYYSVEVVVDPSWVEQYNQRYKCNQYFEID